MEKIDFSKITMEQVNEIISGLADMTFESVVEADEFYKETEQKKRKIIKNLRLKLDEKSKSQLDELIECFDDQIYITARGFSFVRVLDLKNLENKIKKENGK